MNIHTHQDNRRFVIACLAIGLCISLLMNGWQYWVRGDAALEQRYPHIDISRNFVEQKNYIGTLQPLRDRLNAFIREPEQAQLRISLYVEFLNTGANILIHPEERMFPASLMKLPIAMAAMKNVEDGVWRASDKLVIGPTDIDTHSGRLAQQPIGTALSIESLIQTALEESDNTAYKVLLRNLKPEELSAMLEHLGLDEFFAAGGKINAKEYSRLFRSLYGATYLNREHSEQLLVWLANSSFRQFLSAGLPEEVEFSHKYAQNNQSRIFSDSGIAYEQGRPYLITVLVESALPDSQQDLATIQRIMRIIAEETFTYIHEA